MGAPASGFGGAAAAPSAPGGWPDIEIRQSPARGEAAGRGRNNRLTSTTGHPLRALPVGGASAKRFGRRSVSRTRSCCGVALWLSTFTRRGLFANATCKTGLRLAVRKPAPSGCPLKCAGGPLLPCKRGGRGFLLVAPPPRQAGGAPPLHNRSHPWRFPARFIARLQWGILPWLKHSG